MTIETLSIAVRMWAWAAVLRLLKHVVPLGSLVRLVHTSPSRGLRQASLADIEAYLETGGRFPARPPANCLERSLAAYRLLCAAGARPTLVIGVKRVGTRAIDGHVWVTIDGRPLGETEPSLAGLVTLIHYDADAAPHAPADGRAGSTRPRVA